MVQNSSMTDIIYDFFTSRILLGYYVAGDRLPSVSYISRQFQVSALTVRTALSHMREEGMIETTERKRSTVIYKLNIQNEQQYLNAFLSRKEGIDDICRQSDILFVPIARLYLQKQNAASIKQIRTLLKKGKGHPAKQITMFYAEIMQPLNNPLALNLHWEIVRFLQMPYLYTANFNETGAHAEKHIKQMLSLIETGNIEKAVEEMQAFNRYVTKTFIESMPIVTSTKPPVDRIPFKWQIYREHPQLCYTLAADLMSKIDACVYDNNEFLPSCQTLAQEYKVSYITMRRTLELLNDICITETLNGIGTRVISGKLTGVPNLSQPIQKNLRFYLQALQIGTLTCKNVAVNTLTSLNDDSFRELEQKIGRHIAEGKAFLLAETCLRFLGENSPSPFIREVYHQLYRLLLWGHILHVYSQKLDASQTHEVYGGKLRKALLRGDPEAFATLFSELMELFYKGANMLLLELGLHSIHQP